MNATSEQIIFQRTGIDYITKATVILFYPCDYDTYRKLKELNYIGSYTGHAETAHRRWSAKLPHNRIWKKGEYKKNSKKEVIATISEPIYKMEPPVASRKLLWYGNDYSLSRYPKASEDEVKPLAASIEQIDDALAAARLWFLEYQGWHSHCKINKKKK